MPYARRTAWRRGRTDGTIMESTRHTPKPLPAQYVPPPSVPAVPVILPEGPEKWVKEPVARFTYEFEDGRPGPMRVSNSKAIEGIEALPGADVDAAMKRAAVRARHGGAHGVLQAADGSLHVARLGSGPLQSDSLHGSYSEGNALSWTGSWTNAPDAS